MNTRDLVYIALFAAIVAALGLVPLIPLPFLPVPITAQTLGVMLAGSILGAKRGALALLTFTALVAAGLPLMPGFRGGLGILLGPSGGFILAWWLGAAVIGWQVERRWASISWLEMFLFNVVGGIVVIYMLGIPWMSVVADLDLIEAAALSAAYIPGDLIKAAVAATIAMTLKRAYPLIQR